MKSTNMKKLMLTAVLASALAVPGLALAGPDGQPGPPEETPANPQYKPGLGASFTVLVECTYKKYKYPIYYTKYLPAQATVKDDVIEKAIYIAQKFEYHYYGATCEVTLINPGEQEKVVYPD